MFVQHFRDLQIVVIDFRELKNNRLPRCFHVTASQRSASEAGEVCRTTLVRLLSEKRAFGAASTCTIPRLCNSSSSRQRQNVGNDPRTGLQNAQICGALTVGSLCALSLTNSWRPIFSSPACRVSRLRRWRAHAASSPSSASRASPSRRA
jgi:hypothetical protein